MNLVDINSIQNAFLVYIDVESLNKLLKKSSYVLTFRLINELFSIVINSELSLIYINLPSPSSSYKVLPNTSI